MVMDKVKNQIVPIQKITGESGHYFFGYYDLKAWSSNGKYHLCHRVEFADRLPRKEDVAQLVMVDMENYRTIPVGETTAWNFQQGAMLQWNPGAPDTEIVYNIRCQDGYKGIIKNVQTGGIRTLSLPVANIDPTGRFGLSINFDRLFDLRPGYGYAGGKDRFFNSNSPLEDGVFRIDLTTGKSRKIISFEQVEELLQKKNSRSSGKKLVINHISFNTDGTRFVFLVRNFPKPGENWDTILFTANMDGSELLLLCDPFYASHYHWRDPATLLIYALSGQGKQLYIMKDRTGEVETVDTEYFLADGHCSYSPDREWILYDSYPDSENYRHLYLYNIAKRKGITLASLYSLPVSVTDIRCDLHPRWNSSGDAVSFDSTHEGYRHVYIMDLTDVMKKFF